MMITPTSSFSPPFFEQELHFERDAIGCQFLPNGQISVTSGPQNKDQWLSVLVKIQTLDLAKIIAETQTERRERFLNNLLRLRKGLVQHGGLPHQILPFYIGLTTVHVLERFFDTAKCSLFSLQHFSTYPTSHPTQAVPTDHAGLQETSDGYHLAVCDGMAHHDPKNIGLVAAAVVRTLLSEPLFKKGRDQTSYQTFLRGLNKDYRVREGTSLLEIEAIRKKSKKWKITAANYGDSALVVLNKEGKITFASRDRKNEKKPGSADPIGMLGIGGGLGDSLIAYLAHDKISCYEGWLIACSDGLIEPFRDAPSGEVDRARFECACRTGRYFSAKKDVPPVAPTSLSVNFLTDNLQQAIKLAAKEKNNGDDVTIIVVQLTPTP